jgi:hypothetical protein
MKMTAERVHENTDQAALYFNRRENYFLVIAEAKQGYGSTQVGEPFKVAGLEFDARIGQLLSQVLDSFHNNSSNDSIPKSPEEYRAFRKKHLGLSIKRNRTSGEVQVMPLHKLQGGYVGALKEAIVISAQDVPTKIAAVLREAFEIAT